MSELIRFIEKSVPYVLGRLKDGEKPEQIFVELAPDFAAVMQREKQEKEAHSRASFIAHLASSLLGPALETTESPEDAKKLAERAVWLAGALVEKSESYVKLHPPTLGKVP